MSCSKLRQCKWDTGAESCEMRCEIMKTKKICKGSDYCVWAGKHCEDAPAKG